ncbi:3'-phosphatase, 5'-polynucleotide kinase [Pseudomonas phage vB_PaeM_FBPa34]|uniref:3'-phosphatase, 5'-polynucleotide kinase n=1 Tax=Pseudomonas phage vB_PaeM_FBPa35 TaxID=2969608 RepID=A0A9E7QPB0_9CAUD|nr:3'-phosphatase, 5'-polynucleotide kinase [Pseudomonas phage vB_PaeM_FBPa34]UVN13935.1 3'-phosphatase, 5'-polynucleotide kinase [Pseudomonas phage vB_PaeM_FBPa35]
MERKPKNGIIIFDLDGCVFDDSHRKSFALERQWDEYHSRLDKDTLNPHAVGRIRNAIDADLMIFFVTGRTDNHFFQTRAKLHRELGIAEHREYELIMRPYGNTEPAPQFKRAVALDILKKIEGVTKIVAAFDDRQDIIDAYNSLGIDSYILNLEGCDAPFFAVAADSDPDSAPNDMAGEPFPAAPNSAPTLDEAFAKAPSPLAETAQSEDPTEDAAPFAMESVWPGEDDSHPDDFAEDVLNNLYAAAEVFRARQSAYGRNDLMYGKIMEILFPNGLVAKTADDHRLALFVMHMVGKLTRLANSGFKDADSALDSINYSAFVHATMRSGRITPKDGQKA